MMIAEQLIQSLNYYTIISKENFVCSRIGSDKKWVVTLVNNNLVCSCEIAKTVNIASRHIFPIVDKLGGKLDLIAINKRWKKNTSMITINHLTEEFEYTLNTFILESPESEEKPNKNNGDAERIVNDKIDDDNNTLLEVNN